MAKLNKKCMTKKSPIVAAAPIRYFDVHRKHNLEKIIKYIGLAKKARADIVCFPESCLKRYGSMPITDKFIKSIQEECRRKSIWCIITEDIEIKKKTYNRSLLIGRDGKIKGGYNKINIYGDRADAGNEIKVFQTDFGKIGIAICWDLTYPGLFSEMAKKGAEIVFCPAMWNYDLPSHDRDHKKRETELLKAMTLARAHENVFFVVLCNPLMDVKTQISYSAISSPHRILTELIDKEGLITSKINLSEVRKFRKYYNKHWKN